MLGAGLGDRVSGTQVCAETAHCLPSLQWWLVAQLHRYPAVVSICSQMPKAVVSQPWLPSEQAWRVGPAVGSMLGAEVGTLVAGATVVGATVVGAFVTGALVTGAAVVGDGAMR